LSGASLCTESEAPEEIRGAIRLRQFEEISISDWNRRSAAALICGRLNLS
jgi:hypothetical protein